MKIYHQAGFRTSWNVKSLNDGCGEGIIFSPVHEKREKIEKFDPTLKQRSLFDPQYYVPDSQKKKINSYDFFPENISDGFSTLDFESIASESAERCIDFQIKNDFEALIIPARYFSQMLTDYINRQRRFTVDPFLHEIANRTYNKPIYLTLPVTDSMLSDSGYRLELLNWITSYPEISGVYLLLCVDERTKQIGAYDTLANHAQFIQDLAGADLAVICGYCNTEGLILAAMDVHAVTIGAYENTRRFSIDKFLDDDGVRMGPAPRIYLPGLLNWIRFDTAVEIREDNPALWDQIYIPTEHAERAFSKGTRPHFTQPDLYHHHFEIITRQYADVTAKGGVPDRLAYMHELVKAALAHYREISDAGVEFFDDNCRGQHLPQSNRLLKNLRKP